MQKLLSISKCYFMAVYFMALIFPLSARAVIPVIDFNALVQLGNQLEQMRRQTQFIETELKKLNGNQYRWSNAQSLINELGKVVQQTNGIAYTASTLDSQFKQAYPGYQSSTNYSAQYQQNTETLLNTLNGTLQGLGTSEKDFETENKRLAFLQSQSQSAEGQTQAIQASSQISSEMVSQIQLLRQTTIAQAAAQNTYYATTIQNDASQKAELEKILTAGSTDIPEYGSSKAAIEVPNS